MTRSSMMGKLLTVLVLAGIIIGCTATHSQSAFGSERLTRHHDFGLISLEFRWPIWYKVISGVFL